MKMQLRFASTIPALTVLVVGLFPLMPAHAQDNGEPTIRARAIIRGPGGDQVIDLDPSQLPRFGPGNNLVITSGGPGGGFTSFIGDPTMVNGGGLAYNLGGGPNGMYGGLNIIDPGVSYLYALLKRTDIGTEIRLNSRQREALELAETNQQEARQQQMKNSVSGLIAGLQGKSQEEMKAALTERATKLQEEMKANTDTRMKTLLSILRPEQVARLKELDFQYRGPLAMGVREVATLATLNPELAVKTTGLLNEYRLEVRKNIGGGPRTVSFGPGAGKQTSDAVTSAPPADSEQARGKLVKADQEIRKARQVLGAKALAGLPDPQRAQWSKLTGKPFEFHPAL